MEEASLDHGLDRLPFFFLIFLFPSLVFATTFGPISAVDQTKNATYVVRGRIIGSSWVMEDRQSRKPHTHWKLEVMEQAKGEKLGPETTIRQPGGELGGLGYHVAGTAQFRGGEEVVVNLRDTEEAGIKEVMGLASGKYTVEKNEEGKSVLRSGLGFLLMDDRNQPMELDSFLDLARRVGDGKQTKEDESIFVNRSINHNHGGPEPSTRLQVKPPAPSTKEAPSSPQDITAPSEESKGSSTIWWIGGFLAFALLGVVALILKP